MSEALIEPTPTSELDEILGAALSARGKSGAVEITLKNSKDGSWYWVRRTDGVVQHIVCRRPVDTSGEVDVERGMSAHRGPDNELLVTRNERRAGTRPEDMNSGFYIPENEVPLGFDLLCDVVVEMDATDIFETDIDEEGGERVRPVRLTRLSRVLTLKALVAEGAAATAVTAAAVAFSMIG